MQHMVHDGDEAGFVFGSSLIEAGKFPTDETDEKFQTSSFITSFANDAKLV
jgi:hypothetical protein